MSGDDQRNSRNQKPYMVLVEDFFEHQEQYTHAEEKKRSFFMMMFSETMAQSQGPYEESETDHSKFKKEIVDDIGAEYGQAG